MINTLRFRQIIIVGFLCCTFLVPSAASVTFAAGTYQADPATGCKIWNPDPLPADSFSWRGECRDGYLEWFGIAHFYSHGNLVGTHEGSMAKGKRSGKGVATWSNGNKYEGDWLDDHMHGTGVMTSTDGAKYDGNWVKDKMHGYGVYTWPSGAKYKGAWADGYMQGDGVLTFPDGREQRGRFEKDKYVGP